MSSEHSRVKSKTKARHSVRTYFPGLLLTFTVQIMNENVNTWTPEE